MSKNFSIPINIGLTVTDETAELCLRLLEIYCNDNDVLPIAEISGLNGTPISDKHYTFKFEKNDKNK